MLRALARKMPGSAEKLAVLSWDIELSELSAILKGTRKT